jgi:large subunit ribosomal protein L17
MRHRNAGIKLGRTASHRKAMFRNMVTSLFKHDRIRTTDVKAKEIRRWADQLVTLAKRGDLHARRQALAIIRERDVVQKLFDEAPKRFGGSQGGYTRVVKIGYRPGDAAPISLVELVSAKPPKKKPAKKKKAAKAAATGTTQAKETGSEAAEIASAAETDTASASAETPAPPTESPVAEAPVDEAAEEGSSEDSAPPKV